MTFEIILLALASTIRPTSLAAVYAILSAGTAPRRLMGIYVACGLAFTVAVGLIILTAFHGVPLHSGTSHTKAVAQIAAGILAIAFGLGLMTGRVGGRRAEDTLGGSGRLQEALSRHLTPRTAAVAGPATHIPGLFYLLALNVIVASESRLPGALVELGIYNAVWFAIPLGIFGLCIFDPPRAREAVEGLRLWTDAHGRTAIVVICIVLGVVLVVTGAIEAR